jgi:tRNA A-37 threonylcarbamoyl transferase component Bud32
MDYINSKRIVHTDLCVKNVMIGDGKVVKITGFGMAKKLDQDVLKMSLY